MSLIFIITLTIAATFESQKQKSLAIAIHNTNVPAAGLIYPYLLDYLTSAYGLNGTFLVLGGVFCNSFAFSLMLWFRRNEFIIRKEKNTGIVRDEDTEITHDNSRVKHLCISLKMFVKKLMSIRFVCLVIAAAFAISTLNGYLDFVFDISDWKGYNELQARNLFTIYNIFTIFFCLSPGVLRQKNIDIYYYPFVLALIGLSGSLVKLYSKTYIMYAIGTACMGAIPGVLSSGFIICSNLVPIELISVAVGSINTVNGLLSAGIGPLYGNIILCLFL